MKQLNFFILLVVAVFCCSTSNAQITVSPWQIHEGKEGTIDFVTKFHGDPDAYQKASIPSATDGGWGTAPTDANGKVNINRRSSLRCNQQLDFTYFQTSVNIPENSRVDKFTVSYNQADDGARVYIFNSANPQGAFDAAADLQYNKKNTGNVDLKSFVKKGEVNRVVIVQFDDCGGGNTLNGINIEVNGELIEVAKDPGQALHFNGTGDYVQLGEVLPKGANYTKEAWVKFESLKQYPNILSSGPSALWIEGTLAAMNNGLGKKLKSPNKIELNKWMHVAVTWDGTTMVLYENGREAARSTDQPAYGGGEIQMGKWPTANNTFFNGEMDEVRIWDYARSAEQISGNKDCELSGKEKGLVAYYQFNQGIAGGDNKNIDKLESTPVGKAGNLKNFARTGMSSNFILTGQARKNCPAESMTPSVDPNWKQMPGAAKQVIAGGTKVFVIGTDDRLYEWNFKTKAWVNAGRTVNSAAVDMNNSIWTVEGTTIMRYKDGAWTKMPGAAKRVIAGGTKVFVIGTDDQLYEWNFKTDNNWTRAGVFPVSAAVDMNNSIWIVEGTTIRRYKDGAWNTMPGAAKQVFAGGTKVFVIGTDDQLYEWNFKTDNNWTRAGVYPVSAAVDVNNTIWTVEGTTIKSMYSLN